MRRWALVPFVIALSMAAPASAQSSLVVRTLEHGEWGASIAALQTDLRSQGTGLHVVVEDASGSRAACGAYQLLLDDAGSRAFDLAGCDASGATTLVLVDRMALFAPGELVSRPRAIGIAAIEVRSGAALGGARLTAESELRCSLAIRPFLVDLATGARVPATPDRFELRPVGEGVSVQPLSDGWSIRAGLVRIEYELVERASGDVVLRETVALRCGAPEAPAPAAAASTEVIELVPDRVFRGATMTRGLLDDRGSCGGEEGPEQWYVVRLDAPALLSLRLVSEFDAALYVRAGSMHGTEIACRDNYARLETLEMNLDAGVYYVAVDGTGTHGRYRLTSFQEAPDPRALVPVPREELANHQMLDGELVPARSGYAASCGGDEAPEHVYWFRVDRPTFVSLRLASRFDAALYLLEASGAELDCRSAIGLAGDTRRSRIATELAPGLYYVVVDGEHATAQAGRYRLALHQLPLR